MSANTAVVVVIVVVVVAAGAWALARARRARDGVDSFRRQIDALSPEARRNVVDQVQNAAEGRKHRDDGPDDDHRDSDGGGARGT